MSIELILLNSLWPSDAMWDHRSESTQAQSMACCLTAPSHYLNQYWLIINGICGIHLLPTSQEIHVISICKIGLKITSIKLLLCLPEVDELKRMVWCQCRKCHVLIVIVNCLNSYLLLLNIEPCDASRERASLMVSCLFGANWLTVQC